MPCFPSLLICPSNESMCVCERVGVVDDYHSTVKTKVFKTLQVDTTNFWYGTNVICVFCSCCLHVMAIYITWGFYQVAVSNNIVLKVCGYAWNAKLYTCTCRFSGQINSFLQWYNFFFENAWFQASRPQGSPEQMFGVCVCVCLSFKMELLLKDKSSNL